MYKNGTIHELGIFKYTGSIKYVWHNGALSKHESVGLCFKGRIRVYNPNFFAVKIIVFPGSSDDFYRLAANTRTWGRKFLSDNW
jgi:hypothetical protein